MNSYFFSAIFVFIVLIAIPIRIVFRFFRKKKVPPSFFQSIFEYSILFFLLNKTLMENNIELGDLGLSNEVPSYGLIFKTILSVIFILGIDYWSVKKIRINSFVYFDKSDIHPENYAPRLIFFKKKYPNALSIIAFCTISGVWEEMYFRGLIFYLLKEQNLQFFIILLISSIAFALYHFSNGLNQVYYSFVFGLFFGSLFLMTNSLLPSIISHIAGNCFVLLYVLPEIKRKKETVFF